MPSASAASAPVTISNKTQTTVISDTKTPAVYKAEPAKPVRTYSVDMTAYTSTVEECDADPFITADGSTVADGIIAANFLPFGTKVRMPELFGDKVFVVHDRMNARYWYRIDVWMNDQKAMRKFGIHHNVKVEIVQMGDGKTQWAKRAEELRLARLQKAKVVSQLTDLKKK
ncbi:3D domain-containing protein [Patescibacteria group bacterium]|nr:3D domain-containing protein [Patescibacteria group bacterium]